MVISVLVHAAVIMIPINMAAQAKRAEAVLIIMDAQVAEARIDTRKARKVAAKPKPVKEIPKPHEQKPAPQPVLKREVVEKEEKVPEPVPIKKEEPQEKPDISVEPEINELRRAPEPNPSPMENTHMVPAPVALSSSVDAGVSSVPEDNSEAAAGVPREVRFGFGSGPRFLRRVLPRYPRKARRLGIEGRVLLRLAIDATGRLTRVEVVNGAGNGFDEEAVSAIRQSTYKPAVHDGKPIACEALLPIRFELRR